MESIDLHMEDIFGEQDDDEDQFTAQGPLPDLPADDGFLDTSATGENGAPEDDAVLARIRDLSRGAARRTVKRLQPKLDATRLTGERGIAILPKVFRDIKLKGRGHEADDLRKVMRFLEHWTHRLFPKMPFDEVLERIEKLGTKKEVQTCIKRMRMDMPVLNEEHMGDGEEVLNSSDDQAEQTAAPAGTDNRDEEDVMEILREEEDRWRQVGTSQATPPTEPQTPSTAVITSMPSAPSTPVPAPITTTHVTDGGMTTEQRERMERNKCLAQEKRLGKFGIRTPSGTTRSQSSLVSSPLTYHSTPSAAHQPSTPATTVTLASSGSTSNSLQENPSNSDSTEPSAGIITETVNKSCLPAESELRTSADEATAAEEELSAASSVKTAAEETADTLPPLQLFAEDQRTEDELLAELDDDGIADDHHSIHVPSSKMGRDVETEEAMDVDNDIVGLPDPLPVEEESLPASVSLLD